MITVLKQDIFNGEKLDTEININLDMTIYGEDLQNFKIELEKLINKYRI
ncbi:MAG TPA: hypothetical protein GX708_23385 [Gallicola sp.]|nr:hypothetical protein [Gallicola sp.]